jgi:hypothetical protein
MLLQVMGFSSRFEADTFIQGRSKYVMGAVHFYQGPSGQLQYLLQTNTSVSLNVTTGVLLAQR